MIERADLFSAPTPRCCSPRSPVTKPYVPAIGGHSEAGPPKHVVAGGLTAPTLPLTSSCLWRGAPEQLVSCEVRATVLSPNHPGGRVIAVLAQPGSTDRTPAYPGAADGARRP
jgi:hypothetical protein